MTITEIILKSGLVPDRKRSKKRKLVNCVTAFDIETTKIDIGDETHAFMYIWQLSLNNELVITGRTWDEYKAAVNEIESACYTLAEENNLCDPPLLVTFVHNLSYEFQFLSGLFDFKTDDVFLRSSRKPIYARSGCIEYRCSYIHSNMGLKEFCKAMHIEQGKLSGQEFDYSIIRYPWTELTEKEIEYCVTDVTCLVDCIKQEMDRDGDTLLTLPLTSTGYCRRECVAALEPKRRKLYKIKPQTIEQYEMLRKAFRGGNTHCNRYFTGKVIENVRSFDMASCYPYQLVTQKFPYEFKEIAPDIEHIHFLIKSGCAVVFTALFKNIRLRDEHEPIPYIALAKTESTGGAKCCPNYARGCGQIVDKKRNRCPNCTNDFIPIVTDNGRILQAGISKMTITEIDYEIIYNQYEWDAMIVQQAMFAEKDFLPDEFIQLVLKYYNAKTSLKGVEDELNQYFYGRAKNKLNSFYGMLCTNAIQDIEEYIDGEMMYQHRYLSDEEKLKALSNAKFPYQWGVYCTAYARHALQEFIDECGTDVIYCDTDSVKFIGEHSPEKINRQRIAIDRKRKAYAADSDGVIHYLGVYEDDGHYDRFITQGAKRYAYESAASKHGALHCVVSGVSRAINESTGIPFSAEELGAIENFKPGMIWRKAGGTTSKYNDDADITLEIDGHSLHIGRNVAIIDSTYELSYSDDYADLLDRLTLYNTWRKDGRI